jgi:hypothetical protein
VSRPDRRPDVAVDFAPPRQPKHIRPLVALVVVGLIAGAVTVAVTQLLLH